MKALTGVAWFVLLHTLLLFPHSVHAARQTDNDHSAAVEWTSREAQHVYGLPDAKAKDKGSLTLSGTDLSFTGKAGSSSIPRRSIIAVSAGNQRVEIWGMKGRVLRMVIPDVREKIEMIVSKNSGGIATYAKITATRKLGIPVVMIARPNKMHGHAVDNAANAVMWLEQQLAHRAIPGSARGV